MDNTIQATDLLLVIDTQNGFVNKHSEHVIEPICDLIEQYVQTGQPIVLTRFLNTPESQWEKLMGWTELCGPPQTDLHPKILSTITDTNNMYIIDKYGYTALTPELETILEHYKPRRILVCGIATDACVLKTAVDLFENSHIPVVLENLCASEAGETVHLAGLLLLKRFIGTKQVIHSTEV